MLRCKTETRPGLVALYDIRPGNGAGQFLQPQSPHGAASVQCLRLLLALFLSFFFAKQKQAAAGGGHCGDGGGSSMF